MATTDGLVPESARNVGGLDRTLRWVGGAALLAVGVAGFAAGWATVGAVAALTGVGLLFNAVTGFCVMNALLGIDTCSKEEC